MVIKNYMDDFLRSGHSSQTIMENSISKITPGLLVGNRGSFPGHLCDAGRNESAKMR